MSNYVIEDRFGNVHKVVAQRMEQNYRTFNFYNRGEGMCSSISKFVAAFVDPSSVKRVEKFGPILKGPNKPGGLDA